MGSSPCGARSRQHAARYLSISTVAIPDDEGPAIAGSPWRPFHELPVAVTVWFRLIGWARLGYHGTVPRAGWAGESRTAG